MRVLRVYHSGRDASHRARDRALVAAGIDVTLVVPSRWPDASAESRLTAEPFRVVELPTTRPGDVNRHAYRDSRALSQLIRDVDPDVLDIHEEPYSLVTHQWLRTAPAGLPVVTYTSQNVDKRLPPPFFAYERRAHKRARGLYACSRQAASVARGKGFSGLLEVLPLGYQAEVYHQGSQSLGNPEIALGLFGRLVPEKGVRDAVRVLAQLNLVRPARLRCIGYGPEAEPARTLAARLGVLHRVEFTSWLSAPELAHAYRRTHVVLVPSRETARWVEQFGRVIVEAQASGAVVAGYASGAIPDVAGAAALLTDVGRTDELARRVIELTANPADYERRRTEGARIAADRTWERVAERQAALYEAVLRGARASRRLSPSPRARRAAARAEFGPPATTPAGQRPFALPVLRHGGTVADGLAALIDSTSEVAARAAPATRAVRRAASSAAARVAAYDERKRAHE